MKDTPLDVRALGEQDLSRLADLFPARLGPACLGFEPKVDVLRRQTVLDPDYDPALFLGAFREDRIEGALMGVHRPWKASRADTGFVKFLVAGEEPSSYGEVAPLLLSACERVLRDRGVTRLEFGAAAPWYLFPGVPEESAGLMEALEGAGWQKQSRRVSLMAELTDLPPCPPGVPDYVARAAKSEDRPAMASFIRKVFSESWAHEVAPAWQSADAAFATVLVDLDTGRIEGFACMAATNPGWFGPMGVRKELRGKGLGLHLLGRTLEQAKACGHNTVMFPWINENAGLYRKLLPEARQVGFHKYVHELR